MKQGAYTKAAMAIVLAVACMGLAACGGSDNPVPSSPAAGSQQSQDGSEVTAPQAAVAAEPAAKAPAEAAPAAPEETPKAADELEKEPAPAAGGTLTAETLPGTVWSAGALTIAFQADGKLMVNDASEGTWKIEGNTLTVAAMGMEIPTQIEGDKIMYNGTPVERVQ
jgi:hypothetical protein